MQELNFDSGFDLELVEELEDFENDYPDRLYGFQTEELDDYEL